MLQWLADYHQAFPAFNVFRYITFRTGGAVVTALLFVFLFGPAIISTLRLKQGKGQPIRTDGPQSPYRRARACRGKIRALLQDGQGIA